MLVSDAPWPHTQPNERQATIDEANKLKDEGNKAMHGGWVGLLLGGCDLFIGCGRRGGALRGCFSCPA